ncbi:hypothetical protein B0J13DRAFT_634251 [Dactylonectria estremocensis]|uniref:Uncharacterized protein n=1 Tax=Dactylonectria estremocensis TaxID=1079267 RepID=A0A9P9FLE1_9HYPO|nr:hypothetical protein B0J13DRAFT_634251 [Dactylonectria estremocensis]
MAGHYAAMKHSGAMVARLESLVVGPRGRVRECAEVACGSFPQPPAEADGMDGEGGINQVGESRRHQTMAQCRGVDNGDGAMVQRRHFAAWVWSASCKRAVGQCRCWMRCRLKTSSQSADKFIGSQGVWSEARDLGRVTGSQSLVFVRTWMFNQSRESRARRIPTLSQSECLCVGTLLTGTDQPSNCPVYAKPDDGRYLCVGFRPPPSPSELKRSRSEWRPPRSAGCIPRPGLSLIGMGLELGAMVTTTTEGQDDEARARFRDPKRQQNGSKVGAKRRAAHGVARISSMAAWQHGSMEAWWHGSMAKLE